MRGVAHPVKLRCLFAVDATVSLTITDVLPASQRAIESSTPLPLPPQPPDTTSVPAANLPPGGRNKPTERNGIEPEALADILPSNRLALCQVLIFGWPGLEGDSPKPRGFHRSAQSSPGPPTRKPCFDKTLASRAQPVFFILPFA